MANPENLKKSDRLEIFYEKRGGGEYNHGGFGITERMRCVGSSSISHTLSSLTLKFLRVVVFTQDPPTRIKIKEKKTITTGGKFCNVFFSLYN